MTSSQFQYLSTQRAAEFIGDSTGVKRLLGTLKETLHNDLPALRQRLDQDDTQGVNDLLHQFKGFAPVFCVDALVEQVIRVEAISKNASMDELRSALLPLLEQLDVLKAEVERELAGT